jgi:hypothetical protein
MDKTRIEDEMISNIKSCKRYETIPDKMARTCRNLMAQNI